MKPIKRWFGLGPYDEDEGYGIHWYNKNYEHNGTRVRLIAGDLLASDEQDNGYDIGPQFGLDVHLCVEDIDEFYLPDNENAKYDIHTLTAIFWRWGIYLSIRGRVYP